MSHLALRSAYRGLADRLNRFPQGAPPSEVLFQILKMLFSEREAGLVAQLPVRLRRAEHGYEIGDPEAQWATVRSILDLVAAGEAHCVDMVDRAHVVRLVRRDEIQSAEQVVVVADMRAPRVVPRFEVRQLGAQDRRLPSLPAPGPASRGRGGRATPPLSRPGR